MTELETDRELLEATWEAYTEEFADHVGDIVTPDEAVENEEHVDWGAQVFMFGYALGSIAGAQVSAPNLQGRETDAARVGNIVDEVIDIAESNEIPVSSARIKEDFRRD